MTEGANLAAEIAAALAEGGAATGDGPFVVTLEKAGAQTGPDYDPIIGPPTEHTLTALADTWKVRDENGNLTGQTTRVLTLASGGVVPIKGEWLVVSGQRVRIGEVMPFAPGGVDLMYDIVLEG